MLSEEDFIGTFVPFLQEHKDWIYDVYFTCRIPPFTQDAMGSVFTPEDRNVVIENALQIQDVLGIKVSATFNNITCHLISITIKCLLRTLNHYMKRD